MDTNVNTGSSDADSILLQYALEQQSAEDAADVSSPVTLKTGSQAYTDTTDASSSNSSNSSVTVGNNAKSPQLPLPVDSNSPTNAPSMQQLYKAAASYMQNVVNNQSAPSPSAAQFLLDCEQIEVTDPQIIAIAQKEGDSPGLIYKQVQVTEGSLFENQLTNLPPNIADLLSYAHANPSAVSALPASLQLELQQIQTTVNNQLIAQYGFSADWPGITPNDTFFNQEVMDHSDATFETNLQQYASTNNLSESDVAKLLTMHYMPGTYTPETTGTQLTAILNQLTQQTNSAMQSEYGQGYTSTTDTNYYTQELNGAFRQTFQDALTSQTPPLTAADQNIVIALYANPNDPSISAADKTRLTPILQSITASSISQVQEDFGLQGIQPPWQPIVTTINNPNVDPAMIKGQTVALKISQEMLGNAQNLISQMPPGAQQTSYKNYLKAIGDALAQFENFLNVLQGSNAAVSNRLAQTNFNEQTNELNAQNKAASEAQKDTGKMHSMPSWLNNITDWVGKITACVLGGPELGAFYLIDQIVSAATGQPPLTQRMFGAITGLVDKIAGPTLGPKIAPAINLVVCAAIASGSPLIMVNMMTSDSGAVGGLVGAMGGSAEAQQMTTLAFNMTAQIAGMVAITILTGGSSAAMVSEELMAMVVEGTNSVLSALRMSATTAEGIGKVMKMASLVYTLAMTSIQVTSSTFTAISDFAQADMTRAQAVADAYTTQIDALISVIKKLITTLQQQMSGTADQITSIGQLLNSIFANYSQIASQISSA